MTTLSSFQKTDNVDDHLAADYNRFLGGVLRAEFVNTETITATKELDDSDCQFQVITPSGANRTVELAPEAITNHVTIVYNADTTYEIPIKDDSGAIVYDILSPGRWAMFVPVSGEGWVRTAPSVKQEVLVGGFAYTSPADSTTYYFGIWDSLALATFSDLRRIYVMQTGTITAVSLFFHTVAGTVGSSETSTLWIRKNDTTDYTVTTTLNFSSDRYSAFVTGLSIPVTAGDYIVFKWTTPAWETNPINVTGYARALLVGI